MAGGLYWGPPILVCGGVQNQEFRVFKVFRVEGLGIWSFPNSGFRGFKGV